MVKDSDRLYARGVFQGFRRGRGLQHEKQALISIEGVGTREDAQWYLGKKAGYYYKGPKKSQGENSRWRTIWGKVVSVHGDSGVVRVRFAKNLPPNGMGNPVRVMLYPNRPKN